MATGNPPDGVTTENSGFDDVMGLTFRLVLPVLQTCNVVWLLLPRQESPNKALSGTWIWGTLLSRNLVKKMSIALDGGVISGGDVSEAKLVRKRPAAHAFPL
jgi:hypothetical protein